MESFYSAISTFLEVKVLLPLLLNTVVDVYYRILQTYIVVKDLDSILEQVVINALLYATASKKLYYPLESFYVQGMQDCIILCAKIYKKLGAFYPIRDCAEDAISLDPSYGPA